jgi:cytochrome c biogenesis protein CcmG/thiol:disulfide interchange protein DsbE
MLTSPRQGRRPLLLLALGGVLVWYASAKRPPSGDSFDVNASPTLGEPAPPLRAALLAPGPMAPAAVQRWRAGTPVTLAQHRGAPVVLEFWATWCKPCIANRPAVARLAARYAHRGLVVYGIPYRETRSHVLKWLSRDGGAQYPELQDEGSHIANAYWVHGIPQMFLIGPDGRIRWHCWGCDNLQARLYPVLDSVLGPSSDASGSSAKVPAPPNPRLQRPGARSS